MESKRSEALGGKNGFCRQIIKTGSAPGGPELFVRKMNGRLAADPHAANPPAIAVPETLPLPDAIIIICDIGRTAVITVTWSIIARPVSIIAGARKRAAHDGPADQSGSDAGGNPAAAGFGGCGRRHGRNSEGGDGSECHQFRLHDVTFLKRARTADKAARRGKSSICRLKVQ